MTADMVTKLNGIAAGANAYTHPAAKQCNYSVDVSSIIPVGIILWYSAKSAPSGWLICDGRLVNKSDYQNLFAVLGNTFGTSTNTQFYLPNLQAAFIRGAGSQNGYSATFGKKQEATQVPNTITGGSGYSHFAEYDKSVAGSNGAISGPAGSATKTLYSVRPYNIALTPIIKY